MRVLTAIIASSGIAYFALNAPAENAAKPTDLPATDLRTQLLGAWALAGEPDSANQPGRGARIKFFGLNQWTITQSDPDTGALVFHHGGSFVLNGDRYEETIEYAAENTAQLVGKRLKFTISVDGDTYVQRGIGNPYSERWVRIRQ